MKSVKATLNKVWSGAVIARGVAAQMHGQKKMKTKQQTLAMATDQSVGLEPYRKPTKRDTFLDTMERQRTRALLPMHHPSAQG